MNIPKITIEQDGDKFNLTIGDKEFVSNLSKIPESEKVDALCSSLKVFLKYGVEIIDKVKNA